MIILPGALPAVSEAGIAAARRPVLPPVAPIEPATASERSRNRTGAEAGGQDGRSPVLLMPIPDPDRPTGPPPAFEANLLEAQRERQRAPQARSGAEARQAPPAAEAGPAEAGRQMDITV